MSFSVVAFYRFTPLAGLPDLRQHVQEVCACHAICGTLLLAPEGFNGTLAGTPDDMRAAAVALDTLLGFAGAEVKWSHAAKRPFKRLKIRIKKEIITLGAPEAKPAERAGIPVSPSDWNALIARGDVMLLDTRNDYETEVGAFAGAVDPRLKTFTDFKAYAATLKSSQKIAMYCTGGIRCEKASSYLLGLGFDEVYQLQGGILKYLAEVPTRQSRWQGTCFVFDERGSLGPGLTEQAIERN